MLKQINKSLKFGVVLMIAIFLTLGFSISLQSILATWTAPADNPPTSNIGDLLIGGSLGVGSDIAVAGNSILSGNVGIGAGNPGQVLDVAGAASIDNNLITQIEGGLYYGRVRVSENQLNVANYGTNWIHRGAIRGWTGVAISSDGKYQTAVVGDHSNNFVDDFGFIYTSINYGTTWSQRGLSLMWEDVAMSADGKHQTAVVKNGYVYTSTNYGAVWTQRGQTASWSGVAVSADGRYQTTITSNDFVYNSVDYGVTWTKGSLGGGWSDISMSSDGKFQTGVKPFDGIYTSMDYGITWNQKYLSNGSWSAVAMSSDGQYQTATMLGNLQKIYTSKDYGETWTGGGSFTDLGIIAMSADGKYQTTGQSSNGSIYTSANYGVTWAPRTETGQWEDVAISSDGKYQTAVSQSGYIATSYADSYIYGGSIGVGIMNPGSQLHLYKSDTSGANSEIALQSGTYGKWSIYNNGNAASGNDGSLRFWNNSIAGEKNALTILDNGNIGIGVVSPNLKLHVDTGNTSNGALLLTKSPSTPAFSVLPWNSQVYISAGIYYKNGAWIQQSDTSDNQLFVLDPGSGALWYASNDGTGSWNIASGKKLWDSSGVWKNGVNTTDNITATDVCTAGGKCLSAVGGNGSGEQIFTSSGTFTVPTGVRVFFVTAVGGGGGGGGGRANGYDVNIGNSGGGGGSGQFVQDKLILIPSTVTTIAITIGAGGTAGSAGGGNGGNGGSTSFGSYLTMPGGTGGKGAPADDSPAPGGTGGTSGGQSQRGVYVYPCYCENSANGGNAGAYVGGSVPKSSYCSNVGSNCCYGSSGGGGGASITGNGGTGGSCTGSSTGGTGSNGGIGGGGGGGGTSYSGYTPGKGGSGGSGYIKITWIN